VTYKARAIEDGREVAIKPFRFFSGDNWSDYKAIEREMETLKRLLHRGIPRYEGYFDSGEGICLVQEYIDAKPLSKLDLY
jgi:serine/threonine protein kinase